MVPFRISQLSKPDKISTRLKRWAENKCSFLAVGSSLAIFFLIFSRKTFSSGTKILTINLCLCIEFCLCFCICLPADGCACDANSFQNSFTNAVVSPGQISFHSFDNFLNLF